MAVAPWIVSEELWELVEPLLPVKERRFRYPGRRRLPDREAGPEVAHNVPPKRPRISGT